MKRFFFLLLAAILASACGVSRRVSTDSAQPWVGYTTQDILTRMGDPTRIDDDGKGGSVLIYESMPDYTSPDYDILSPEATPGPRRYAHFYLDDEGYCYKVDTNRSLPAPPSIHLSEPRVSFWIDLLIWTPILLIGILL
jgi:hypothetical protein